MMRFERTRWFLGLVAGVALAAVALMLVAPHASATRTVIVKGRITDGSGHGWPLLAKVTAVGASAGPVLSDPYTGAYSIALAPNASYDLEVVPEYPGYQSVSRNITMGGSGQVDDVAVPIAVSCTAPGYRPAGPATALDETFDGTTVPAGWTVVNNTEVGGWVFNDPYPRGNLTGGSGGFAIIDSDYLGAGLTEDTFLVSPTVDLSGVANPVLGFDTDYRGLDSVADVDVSNDGGSTWTNLWEHTSDDVRGPTHVSLPLPSAAGQSQVQVRFHYTGTWAWWWEIDDVTIAVSPPACTAVPGGLVAGLVTDPFTHAGVGGATVTSVDNPSDTTTVAAPQPDPMINSGFYVLFSSLTGNHQFVAAAARYPNETQTVNVVADQVASANPQMYAARLFGKPATVQVTLRAGQTRTVQFAIVNAGGAAGTADLAESPDTPWLSEQQSELTVPPKAQASDQLIVDTTGLAPGAYTTLLSLTTADSPYPIPSVPVTIVIQAAR